MKEFCQVQVLEDKTVSQKGQNNVKSYVAKLKEQEQTTEVEIVKQDENMVSMGQTDEIANMGGSIHKSKERKKSLNVEKVENWIYSEKSDSCVINPPVLQLRM